MNNKNVTGKFLEGFKEEKINQIWKDYKVQIITALAIGTPLFVLYVPKNNLFNSLSILTILIVAISVLLTLYRSLTNGRYY